MVGDCFASKEGSGWPCYFGGDHRGGAWCGDLGCRRRSVCVCQTTAQRGKPCEIRNNVEKDQRMVIISRHTILVHAVILYLDHARSLDYLAASHLPLSLLQTSHISRRQSLPHNMQEVRHNLSTTLRTAPDVLHVPKNLDALFCIGYKARDELRVI